MLRHRPRPAVPYGTDHHAAKLDPASVAELRDLRAEGWTFRELAARYSVSRRTAWCAATGITWRSVAALPTSHGLADSHWIWANHNRPGGA